MYIDAPCSCIVHKSVASPVADLSLAGATRGPRAMYIAAPYTRLARADVSRAKNKDKNKAVAHAAAQRRNGTAGLALCHVVGACLLQLCIILLWARFVRRITLKHRMLKLLQLLKLLPSHVG